MKKLIALLLALSLLLAGCGAEETQEETAPKETTAVTETFAEEIPETAPDETIPQETAPAQTIPEETAPAETIPEETAPAQTKPQETKPTTNQTTNNTKPTTNQTNTNQTADSTKPTTNQTTNNTKPTTNQTTNTQKPAGSNVLHFNYDQITVPCNQWSVLEYTYTGTNELTIYTINSDLVHKGNGRIFPNKADTYYVYISDGVYNDVVTVIAVPQEETAVGKIYFEQTELQIEEGDYSFLTVKGADPGGHVTYTSSNPKIATATGGLLLGVSPGTAVITATYLTATATITIVVTPDPNIVRINLDTKALTMELYTSTRLTWTYNGTKELKWSTTNADVARVDIMGTLIAEGEGTCSIYLSDGVRYAFCEVTVIPNPKYPYATEIKTANMSEELYDGVVKYAGTRMSLEVWAVPLNTMHGLYITTSDRNIVRYFVENVSESDGTCYIQLIFSNPGTATITFTSCDGKATLSYRIVVEASP